MKKILASLVLAGLTAAAFAQTAPATTTAPAPTVALSGDMNFGGMMVDSYTGTNTAVMRSFDPVNSTNGRMNFNIKYDAGSYGWYLRLREQDNWTDGNSGLVTARRAYAWADLASGAVRVSAGRLNTQSWAYANGASWEDIGSMDGMVGSTVEFKLVDGLNFGGYVPFNPTNDNPSSLLLESIIAGAYKIPGLGEVEAGFTPGANDLNGNYGNDGMLFINAGYSAMPGLTSYVQVVSGYIGDQVLNFTYVSEKVGYNNFGSDLPLNVQMLASQQISANSGSKYGSNGGPAGVGLYFNPQVDYTMDIFNFGLSGVILYETETLGTYSDGNQIQSYGYEFDPFVKANVAKNVSIKWFVGFTSGADTLGAGDSYIGGTAPGFRDPRGTSYFQKNQNTTGQIGTASNPFSSKSALYWQQAGANAYSLFGVLPQAQVKTGVSLSVAY